LTPDGKSWAVLLLLGFSTVESTGCIQAIEIADDKVPGAQPSQAASR
jgi:hypothetical protein